MSVWHFDFEEPTAVLLQMSDGGINSHWGWAECTDSVLFVGPGKASPVLRCVSFRPLLPECQRVRTSNPIMTLMLSGRRIFQKRQILNQDKSQGNLSRSGFGRILLQLPRVWATVNKASKACLCTRCWLQTSVSPHDTSRVCVLHPQWSSAENRSLHARLYSLSFI